MELPAVLHESPDSSQTWYDSRLNQRGRQLLKFEALDHVIAGEPNFCFLRRLVHFLLRRIMPSNRGGPSKSLRDRLFHWSTWHNQSACRKAKAPYK
jgi:hypothetical protein